VLGAVVLVVRKHGVSEAVICEIAREYGVVVGLDLDGCRVAWRP
jgi:hypothetical protein